MTLKQMVARSVEPDTEVKKIGDKITYLSHSGKHIRYDTIMNVSESEEKTYRTLKGVLIEQDRLVKLITNHPRRSLI